MVALTPFDEAWSVLKYYQDSAGRLTVDDPEQGLRPMDMETDGQFPIELPGPKTQGEFIDDYGRDQIYIRHLERLARRLGMTIPGRPDTVAPYFRDSYHYRGRPNNDSSEQSR